VGRPFDVARSIHVVTNNHTELVQMIIALKRTILNISNYLLTFDESYRLLKTDVTDQFTYYLFIFGSLQSALIFKMISWWLILSKDCLFVLAFADSRSTCVDFSLLFDTHR